MKMAADKKENAASDSEEETIEKDIVVTKYKMAGDMINRILTEVIAMCKADVSVIEICEYGDKKILEETAKVFKKEKDMKKGIAFPTCVSINNCICHYSPLKSDPESHLKDGDIIKIDMGCHIDGFVAVVAHTLCIGATKENKLKGKAADAVLAAYYAQEAAFRMLKPGTENVKVTDIMQKAAEDFKCKPIEGMMSHQLKQFRIDGEKAIIQNPNEAQRKEHDKCELETHEVYGLDTLVSSGEGKGRLQDTRTTVFKKTDETYQLKMKASRAFFSECDKKFYTMPFSLRMFEDEKKARMGVVECERHKLLEPFEVLYEREGEYVAQFKSTVLLMPNGPMRITGVPFDPECYESEYSIEDEDVKKLLNTSVSKKAAKKKKKKAEKQAGAAAGVPAATPPVAAPPPPVEA